MLTGACLGNDALLAHPTAKQNLPQGVVDLMRPCVIQVLALEVDLCPSPVGPAHHSPAMIACHACSATAVLCWFLAVKACRGACRRPSTAAYSGSKA